MARVRRTQGIARGTEEQRRPEAGGRRPVRALALGARHERHGPATRSRVGATTNRPYQHDPHNNTYSSKQGLLQNSML